MRIWGLQVDTRRVVVDTGPQALLFLYSVPRQHMPAGRRRARERSEAGGRVADRGSRARTRVRGELCPAPQFEGFGTFVSEQNSLPAHHRGRTRGCDTRSAVVRVRAQRVGRENRRSDHRLHGRPRALRVDLGCSGSRAAAVEAGYLVPDAPPPRWPDESVPEPSDADAISSSQLFQVPEGTGLLIDGGSFLWFDHRGDASPALDRHRDAHRSNLRRGPDSGSGVGRDDFGSTDRDDALVVRRRRPSFARERAVAHDRRDRARANELRTDGDECA